jgi:hypothetical protein
MIKFIVKASCDAEDPSKKKQFTRALQMMKHKFEVFLPLFDRPPSSHLSTHPEERGAIALLTSIILPLPDDSFVQTWINSLIKRGASIHARGADGDTPIENWCASIKPVPPKSILFLLDAGADLDTLHSTGCTALYHLCKLKHVEILRTLSNAGWLESAHLDMPIALLQHMLSEKPADNDVAEMLELLVAQKQHWKMHVRAAVVAELTVHEQLVPELAELIVSFMDGSSSAKASST